MLRAQRPMQYFDWVNDHESYLLDAWEAMQRLARVDIYIFDQYTCSFARFCELAYAHSSIPESWVGDASSTSLGTDDPNGGGGCADDSPSDE